MMDIIQTETFCLSTRFINVVITWELYQNDSDGDDSGAVMMEVVMIARS